MARRRVALGIAMRSRLSHRRNWLPLFAARHALVACMAALALFSTSCLKHTRRPTGDELVYVVRAGDTLRKIADRFAVATAELQNLNHIRDANRIFPGQRLRIPGRGKSSAQGVVAASHTGSSLSRNRAIENDDDDNRASAKQSTSSKASTKTLAERERERDRERKKTKTTEPRRYETRRKAKPGESVAYVESAPPPRPRNVNAKLDWPVKGVLYSKFGPRDGRQHDGIDISASYGSPIVAADSGVVLYSGEQRGYGNLILVEHPNGLVTVYAHCSKRLAREGEKIRRGQKIGEVGTSGKVSGPHLHFEVRENAKPVDPMRFLP